MRRSKLDRALRTNRTWVGTDAKVVRHVRVCGNGRLAAATRIELERLGIHRQTDFLLPSLRPALVIACADGEADRSFNDVAQRAVEEGSPLLFCCVAGRIVRLGPLIDPLHSCVTLVPPPPEARDAAGSATPRTQPQPAASETPPPEAQSCRLNAPATPDDTPLDLQSRLGALLVSAQALNFLLGARNQCVRDRVVELNPWSMESKGYRVFPN